MDMYKVTYITKSNHQYIQKVKTDLGLEKFKYEIMNKLNNSFIPCIDGDYEAMLNTKEIESFRIIKYYEKNDII